MLGRVRPQRAGGLGHFTGWRLSRVDLDRGSDRSCCGKFAWHGPAGDQRLGRLHLQPGLERSGPIEIKSEADYDKVLRWYEQGLIQILDQRPDIDHALRIPGAPTATLMGPYQFNVNMPGSTWFIPLTDAAWLNSALINLMDVWHYYMIDEWNGGRPAGLEKWIREGMLELPVSDRERRATDLPGRAVPDRLHGAEPAPCV